MPKKILKIVGIVLAAIIAVVGIYIAYVFISNDRIEDNKSLTINSTTDKTNISSEVTTGTELTMTSYNIGFGAYTPDFDFFMDGGTHSWALSKKACTTNVTNAGKVIANANPDFAIFQEVDFDATRTYHVDERDVLTQALVSDNAVSYDYVYAQNYHSPYLMYPITEPHGANNSCIMSYSKTKISSATRYSLPIETGFSSIFDLDRCYSKSYIDIDNGQKLVLYNFHLSAFTSKKETAQNQLKLIVEDMEKEYRKGNYCIGGGDFNRDLLGDSNKVFGTEKLQENWCSAIDNDIFSNQIKLIVPYNEDNPIPTCRDSGKAYYDSMPQFTLDGFIVSANVQVNDADVLQAGYKYSDHNPVYMKFELLTLCIDY